MSSTLPGAVSSIDSIRLALLSWPEVDDYLNHCQGLILPIGST
jgi:creatinine amidohydrolase